MGGSLDVEDPLLVLSDRLDKEDIGTLLELLPLLPELNGGSKGRGLDVHLEATGV